MSEEEDQAGPSPRAPPAQKAPPAKKVRLESKASSLATDQSRLDHVKKLIASGKLTNTRLQVGFGEDVFDKGELATIEKCKKTERCWLVACSDKGTLKERATFCMDLAHTHDCPEHVFSQKLLDHIHS